jgi:hypothetical protein
MSNILYIDNQIVDLDSEIPFPISYSIGDFKNPENRKRSVSKTIKVSGTQNNKRIFSGAYNLSLTDVGDALGFDFNPNIKVRARYIRNGIEIFNGLVRLLNVEIEQGNYSFEIVLFADFINIIKGMSDLNVNELDWSEYDHDLTKFNIEDSWDTSVMKKDSAGVSVPTSNYTSGKPDGFGYWYPVMDFEYGSGVNTINIENFVPYVYVKETIEKCFANLGYTIESDFFDTNMFKALTWGFGGGKKESTPPADASNRQVEYDFDTQSSLPIVDTINAFGTPSYGYSAYVSKRYYLSQFAETLVNDGYAQYNSTANRITIQKSGSYNLQLNYNSLVGYSVTTGTTSGNLRIVSRVVKNGRVISSASPFFFSTSAIYNQTTNTQLNLVAGDEIYVDFFIQGILRDANPFTIDLSFDLQNAFNLNLTSLNGFYVENDVISLNRFIPNLKCSEFVKGVINMFNLYVSEPNEDGVVNIEPLQNYYSGEENWSELLDYSKPINIKPSVNDSAKKYNFKFAEDKDYYRNDYFEKTGEQYGDYTYESDNEYNKNEIDFVLPFAQTIPIATAVNRNYVIPTIKASKDGGQTFEPYKGKPRIFFNNGLKPISGSWSLNYSFGLHSYTSYPQAHHAYEDVKNPTFDLNFGKPVFTYYDYTNYKNNNLFTKYNRISIVEQTSIDGKVLSAYFNLNESTIGDFSTLVNINGVLYRKNLITDYDANGYETTKVELYKVLETTEIEPSNPVIVSSSPSYITAKVSSPKGVGGGTSVIRGGKNSVLQQNPIIVQL